MDDTFSNSAKRLGVASGALGDAYGRSRAERSTGAGDWVRAGIPTAIDSDHMIGMDPNHAMNSFHPFPQACSVATRRNQQGEVWGRSQKISPMQAPRAIAGTAAWMSFREQAIGSIEPGKLADLAMIGRDYPGCPEADIRKIKVLLTMARGKIVDVQN